MERFSSAFAGRSALSVSACCSLVALIFYEQGWLSNFQTETKNEYCNCFSQKETNKKGKRREEEGKK